MTLRPAWLLLCLLLCLLDMPLLLCGQAQTPATPATPAAQTPTPPATPAPAATTTTPPSPGGLPPPKYTPNLSNTGTGLSIEPFYWLTRGKMLLRTGDDNINNGVSSDLDYPGKIDHAYGATVIVPVNNNSSIRFTYFQTAMMNGGTVTSENLNLFGTAISLGDPLANQAQLANYKLSYDYVTYYWNKKRGDIRMKTLYEIQYTTISTSFDDFQLQTDGSYNVNPGSGTTQIILPTLGLGFDGTLSKHLRWETRTTGFGIPHRAKIADGEGNLAVRFGRFELIGGVKGYYFRTSRRSGQFNTGAPWGPYAGLRFYWSKKY